MDNIKKKTRSIYSLQLAKDLLKKGCKIVDVSENTKMRGIVFYFENNELVEKMIELHTKAKEIKRNI